MLKINKILISCCFVDNYSHSTIVDCKFFHIYQTCTTSTALDTVLALSGCEDVYYGVVDMSEEIVEDAIKYCRAKNRICPMPRQWNKLWGMLPGSDRVTSGLRPPSPLILGSWYDSTPDMKIGRLTEHIKWADNHHAIDPFVSYLYGLSEEDWLHFGE